MTFLCHPYCNSLKDPRNENTTKGPSPCGQKSFHCCVSYLSTFFSLLDHAPPHPYWIKAPNPWLLVKAWGRESLLDMLAWRVTHLPDAWQTASLAPGNEHSWGWSERNAIRVLGFWWKRCEIRMVSVLNTRSSATDRWLLDNMLIGLWESLYFQNKSPPTAHGVEKRTLPHWEHMSFFGKSACSTHTILCRTPAESGGQHALLTIGHYQS